MDAETYARATMVKSVLGARVVKGRALDQEELRAMFAACETTTQAGARNAALRALAHGVGLRRYEVVGLDLANSPWASSYFALWHSILGIRVGHFVFERSIEWVVNNGLMVVFFFVVGLGRSHHRHADPACQARSHVPSRKPPRDASIPG